MRNVARETKLQLRTQRNATSVRAIRTVGLHQLEHCQSKAHDVIAIWEKSKKLRRLFAKTELCQQFHIGVARNILKILSAGRLPLIADRSAYAHTSCPDALLIF